MRKRRSERRSDRSTLTTGVKMSKGVTTSGGGSRLIMHKMAGTVLLVLFWGALTSSLPLEDEIRRRRALSCRACPAGTYMSSCDACSACPEETFTDSDNRETSCHPCFKDCKHELNLQVAKACTNTSDVQCECKDGYVCIKRDYIDRCVRCKRQPPVNMSMTPKQTLPPQMNVSQTHGNTPSDTPTETPSRQESSFPDQNLWISLVVVLVVLVTASVLYVFCKCRRNCLKKWVKQCSVMTQKEGPNPGSSRIHESISHHPWYQLQHTPTPTSTNSGGATDPPTRTEPRQQATGNLGPLHIYGAGTVFVSLMNHFGLSSEDKDEEPVNQTELHSPTWSTCPLSTEERSSDSGYISAPSQEQGKECHVSKEEGL